MKKDPFELVSTTIDSKYRVDQVVGEGGFGVVYQGFHKVFEHPVAIKCVGMGVRSGLLQDPHAGRQG